ncbi:MAG: hypothetical protein BWX88_04686 [Planctomycetes bacterium ADurb.Bin126]|nr:MAG: hypothetical protein BWX88_04686 [Planctomycetes bacterium ADurb.Bin126]HOD82804.1 hypothetical protein [Phycisphaerae bacterium]HQL75223.1 hypothetical protein [Phycisphaerae bacterium]
MAINTKTPEGVEVLDPMFSRLASAASAVLALGGAALVVILALVSKLNLGGGAYVLGWLVLLGIVVGASVQLLRGQVWAQRFLLIFWMLVALAALLLVLGSLLWSLPAWWPAELAVGWVILPALLVSAGVVALLTRASPPNTRLRYGTFSLVSAGIVLALMIVVNFIAQDMPVRKDFESLGSYRISERTVAILKGVEQPVTVTVVYTSQDEKRKGEEFAPRVLEQLQEMKFRLRQLRRDATMEIVNVTTDSQKAALLRRIREKMAGQATGHVQLLRSIDNRAETLTRDLQAELKAWQELPADSYVRMWSLSADIQLVLKELARQVGALREKVQSETQGSALTDYAGLVKDVQTTVEETQAPLERIGELMATLSKIPPEVAKNAKGVQESLAKSDKAVQAMQQALGGDKAVPAAEAAKALKQFAQSAQAAQDQLLNTAEKLANVGGKDGREALGASEVWVYQRMDLTTLYAALSQAAGQLAEQADALVSRLTPEALVEQIQALRPHAAGLVQTVTGAGKAANAALEQLSKADPGSQKLLARAEGKKLFEKITAPLQAILDEIKKLPELKEDNVVRELGQENVVIIEVGNKVKVATFDEVYPVRLREQGMPAGGENEKRVFNGGSAIASKILSMTRKPFATVLMTYLGPDPMMMRMRGGGGITPAAFSTLRRRLEEANFEVGEWELSQDKPKGVWVCGACGHVESNAADAPEKCKQCGAEKRFEKRPQVLLVLPPNPPSPPMGMGAPPPPSFGPQQVEKIKAAIDAGTPAVFLAHYNWPSMMGPPAAYPLNAYLKSEWGLECRTDFRLIPGEPDERVPDAYKINLIAFTYMPISSFTDQAIGEPLQGQKTVWNNACPVTPTAPPPGVDVQPVLVVPEGRRNIWATQNLIGLIQRIRSQPGTLIRPEEKDQRTPLTLVAAASRDATKQPGPDSQPASQATSQPAVSPARIVVAGVGQSFLDGYLDEPMPVVGAKTQFDVTDPPLANADLIINSAYWLSGNVDYIASGPVQVKPVNVPADTRQWLWLLCVIGLPAAVVAIGVLVLVARRA